MSGYREISQGPLLDFTMKKYTSHRSIPIGVKALLEADYKAYYVACWGKATETRKSQTDEDKIVFRDKKVSNGRRQDSLQKGKTVLRKICGKD